MQKILDSSDSPYRGFDPNVAIFRDKMSGRNDDFICECSRNNGFIDGP